MPVVVGRPGLPPLGEFATDTELATHAADTTSVHGITDTSVLLTTTAGNAAYAGKNVPVGESGRTYGMLLGALRNDGSPDYFQPIDDADHAPTFIDSVSTSTTAITITHSTLAAAEVGSVLVVPDETFTAAGFVVGASVNATTTTLSIYQDGPEFGDYVYYNGSAWVSTNSIFTPTFNAGTLTLTHDNIPNAVARNYASVVSRTGVYVCNVDGMAATTMTVQFRDYAGTLITTADTSMKCFARHGGNSRGLINPQTLDTSTYPFSNLWLFGVMET